MFTLMATGLFIIAGLVAAPAIILDMYGKLPKDLYWYASGVVSGTFWLGILLLVINYLYVR